MAFVDTIKHVVCSGIRSSLNSYLLCPKMAAADTVISTTIAAAIVTIKGS